MPRPTQVIQINVACVGIHNHGLLSLTLFGSHWLPGFRPSPSNKCVVWLCRCYSTGNRLCRFYSTGNRQQATGNRQQATGNRQQAVTGWQASDPHHPVLWYSHFTAHDAWRRISSTRKSMMRGDPSHRHARARALFVIFTKEFLQQYSCEGACLVFLLIVGTGSSSFFLNSKKPWQGQQRNASS